MHLKKITFHNYGPFKDTQTVEFSESDSIIAVQGRYAANAERSNRAGKSSFVEGILYVLFGAIRDKMREIELVHTGADKMYVEATFEIDGKEVTIKRGRTGKNKPILDISGLKGTKPQKQKEFMGAIGLDATDFKNTFFFQQNKIHGFTEALPSARRKMLQAWLNLSRWEDYCDKAKIKVGEFINQKTILTGKASQLQSQLDQLGPIPDLAEFQRQIDAISIEKDVVSKEIQDLQVQIASSGDSAALKQRESELWSQQTQLVSDLEGQKDSLSTIELNLRTVKDSQDRLEALKQENGATYDACDKMLLDYGTKLQKLQSDLAILGSKKT